MERLPGSLLKGDFLHCKPVDGGPVVKAQIFPAGDELPLVEKVIVCPARVHSSGCKLRGGNYCHWYKGDGFGYMIIAPDSHLRSKRGWK
jgi:hypothetical protein